MGGGLAGPIMVGGRIGGAGMGNAADFQIFEPEARRYIWQGGGGVLGAVFGKGADANDPFWLEDFEDGALVGVADLE